MDTKVRLRRCLVSRRAALSEAEVRQKSIAIASRVCAMSAFCASSTIMVYMALPQEVQTTLIVREARRQHKRIVVPVVDGSRLVAVELPQATARLRRGPYGILEPRWTASVIQSKEIQYIAVPGIAFDRQGGRLGFGKGYYDRFLAQLPATVYRCGLAFCLQVVPYVPRRSHDVGMHGVVTEQGLIPCTANSACRSGDR